MIDLWSSDGLNLPRQMTRRVAVPLPMNEIDFLRLEPSSGDYHPELVHCPNHSDSLLAQMINLNCILLEVNDGIKAITAHPPRPNSD